MNSGHEISCFQPLSQSALLGLKIVIAEFESESEDGLDGEKSAMSEEVRGPCQSTALPISMEPARKMEGVVMGMRCGGRRTWDIGSLGRWVGVDMLGGWFGCLAG